MVKGECLGPLVRGRSHVVFSNTSPIYLLIRAAHVDHQLVYTEDSFLWRVPELVRLNLYIPCLPNAILGWDRGSPANSLLVY